MKTKNNEYLIQLAIDIGNTAIKVGIFDEGNFIKKKIFQNIENEEFIYLLNKVHNSIISSVKNLDKNKLALFPKNTLVFDYKTAIPIKNIYTTPKTLGIDRLANAVGAYALKPNQHNLIIDLGTCLKVDFINRENEFMGGSISPGLYMRLKSLNNNTDKLPLLKPLKINYYTGNSSEQSILSGVMNGLMGEILYFIDLYQKQYGDINIFLTGGDASFFDIGDKYRIFAQPNLTLIGLYKTLAYQK